jgi:hypothetical protein
MKRTTGIAASLPVTTVQATPDAVVSVDVMEVVCNCVAIVWIWMRAEGALECGREAVAFTA